jgi:hypothetical protein
MRTREAALERADAVIHAHDNMATEQGVPLGWVDGSALELARDVRALVGAQNPPVLFTREQALALGRIAQNETGGGSLLDVCDEPEAVGSLLVCEVDFKRDEKGRETRVQIASWLIGVDGRERRL